MVGSNTNSIVGDVFPPESMGLPHSVHLFNRNILILGQEEVDEEECYDEHKPTEEEEKTEHHVAQHGEEGLTYEEGEQHVRQTHWRIYQRIGSPRGISHWALTNPMDPMTMRILPRINKSAPI